MSVPVLTLPPLAEQVLVLQVFAAAHDLHVLTCLFAGFPPAAPETPGQGFGTDACSITFADGGRAVCACLGVPLDSLPSRVEDFWMLPPGERQRKQTCLCLC